MCDCRSPPGGANRDLRPESGGPTGATQPPHEPWRLHRMAGVTFEHVTKRFGDVVAVRDLTLEIADREFLVLLGPSGCGKSTALRMIAGLDEPTEGTIRIGDEIVNDIEPRDRDVAMVFQTYALYPHMTVQPQHRVPAEEPQGPAGRARRARAGGGRDARPRRPARSQAGAALGRPTPARRAGARDRAPAAGVPDGRAAVEPRRQAARADPRRPHRAAAAARRRRSCT